MGDIAEPPLEGNLVSVASSGSSGSLVSEKAADPSLPIYTALRLQCRLLERGEEHGEASYVRRVLRALPRHRPLLTARLLNRIVNAVARLPQHAPLKATLTATSSTPSTPTANDPSFPAPRVTPPTTPPPPTTSRILSPRSTRRKRKATGALVPEVEIYLYLLTTLYHLDAKDLDNAARVAKAGIDAVTKMAAKSSLDPMAARLYQAYFLVVDRQGLLESLRPWVNERLGLFSTRHMPECTAVLMNAFLRILCLQLLFTPAAAFMEKVELPVGVDERQAARHCYYTGCVRAIELKYSESARLLLDALARTHGPAIGFRQRVMKLKVVVDMLAAKEFPEKALFQQPIYRRCLRPYRKIAGAVRQGDVHYFNQIHASAHETFEADGTLVFVNLLRRDVLKTAIRLISKAYSRISLAQLARKLEIESVDDTEYILIRAIKNGWVSAVVDHDAGIVTFTGFGDVYSTLAPTREFHTRLNTLLNLHQRVSSPPSTSILSPFSSPSLLPTHLPFYSSLSPPQKVVWCLGGAGDAVPEEVVAGGGIGSEIGDGLCGLGSLRGPRRRRRRRPHHRIDGPPLLPSFPSPFRLLLELCLSFCIPFVTGSVEWMSDAFLHSFGFLDP